MRIHHALASVAVAAAALTAIVAPAQAADQNFKPAAQVKAQLKAHTSSSPAFKAAADCAYKPNSVNVYTTARDITFSVPSATQEWAVFDETDYLVYFASQAPSLGADDAGPTFTFDPHHYDNSQAGTIPAGVVWGPNIGDENDPDTQGCDTTFSFKRGSKISAALKVSGGYRTLSGKVQSASWGATPKYVSVNAGIVDVQKKLNGVWVTKKTVKTNSSGAYSAKIKAASGEWQAVFRGTSKIGSRTSATSKG